MKRIVIFGSTGSIGCNTLAVVRRFPDQFQVVGLAANRQATLLSKQIAEFQPDAAVLISGRPEQHHLGKTVLWTGREGFQRLLNHSQPDLAVLAVPGSDSLTLAYQILQFGCDLALASKEALVMAGSLLKKEAQKRGSLIIPLDSEHNALFQILTAFPQRPVSRVYLTASGGPFRKRRQKQVSVKEALAHPVWRMGKKVTIDSATMVNKALEVIEAHHLFNLPPEKIKVLIHPEVLVHGLVEFEDGFTQAVLAPADMRFSIASGLFWPSPVPGLPVRKMVNLTISGCLTFQKPTPRRFPALGLAYNALEKGGTAPAVLSVANEEAVSAFLKEMIPFRAIVPTIKTVLESWPVVANPTLPELLQEVEAVRNYTREFLISGVS